MKTLAATMFILLFFCAPAWSQTAKPSSPIELAAYTGPDRERVLFEGAKTRRQTRLVHDLGH